jgi:hypothetical protein
MEQIGFMSETSYHTILSEANVTASISKGGGPHGKLQNKIPARNAKELDASILGVLEIIISYNLVCQRLSLSRATRCGI